MWLQYHNHGDALLWADQQGQLLGIDLYFSVSPTGVVTRFGNHEIVRGFHSVRKLHAFWLRPENQAQANWEWLTNGPLNGQGFTKYDYYRAVKRIQKRNQLLAIGLADNL